MLDDDLLILINGWWEQLSFTLPDVGSPRSWTCEIDTFRGPLDSGADCGPAGSAVSLGPRSLVLLRASR